jgi:hypothetical protein
LPGGTDGVTDMFPVIKFDPEDRDAYCQKTWGVTPDRNWLRIKYWTDDLLATSNTVICHFLRVHVIKSVCFSCLQPQFFFINSTYDSFLHIFQNLYRRKEGLRCRILKRLQLLRPTGC